tara:strand:- start:130 stop:1575 length:1446 start_codon:yes stop_codon:yes gene_type:complete
MAEWTKIEANTDQITEVIRDVGDVVGQIADILNAVAILLEAIAELLIIPTDLLKALLNQILRMLEDIVLTFLQNNIAFCFHSNINFDFEWSWKPKGIPDGELDAGGASISGATVHSDYNPNYTVDGDLPWKGTGLAGWLWEIAASGQDKTDPWRPQTDADSKTGALIGIKALPGFDGLEGLLPLFNNIFFDWKVDKDKEYTKEYWEDIADSWRMKPMKRLGSAMAASIMGDMADGEGEIRVTMDGVKKYLFNQMGPASPFGGPDEGDKLQYFMGSMPVWRSVPLAEILGPPVKAFFEALREIIEQLKFPSDDYLKRLVLLIARKVQQLSELLKQIEEVIMDLADLIDLITDLDWIYLPIEEGGMQGLVTRAVGAEGFMELTQGESKVATSDGRVVLLSEATESDLAGGEIRQTGGIGETGIVFGFVALWNTEDMGKKVEQLMALVTGDIAGLLKSQYEGKIKAIDEAASGVKKASDPSEDV